MTEDNLSLQDRAGMFIGGLILIVATAMTMPGVREVTQDQIYSYVTWAIRTGPIVWDYVAPIIGLGIRGVLVILGLYVMLAALSE